MSMRATLELPLPHLSKGRFATQVDSAGVFSLEVLTDEALFERCGVRLAFTNRLGGASGGDFESLNLSPHVGDDPMAVDYNRAVLKAVLGVAACGCVVPLQVHGDTVLTLDQFQDENYYEFEAQAHAGADAIVVDVTDRAALLCFADCVPIIAVSPSGGFAVVHAGWRGVENNIAVKAIKALADCDKAAGQSGDLGEYNIYIGPHIHSECFEASAEVCARFGEAFGDGCRVGENHIDLSQALKSAFARLGISAARIADADICTACNNEEYFSYRAQNGVCGRQGAYAIRLSGAQ
ncbi:MAG: polyphenol oxidase family protein [Coriobacteriaceae bacterium]|nr:polyphenol oxidase family protein [Coriobacteriaceae bacterium]